MPTSLKSEVILVRTKKKAPWQHSWDGGMVIQDKSAFKTNKKITAKCRGGFIFQIRAN